MVRHENERDDKKRLLQHNKLNRYNQNIIDFCCCAWDTGGYIRCSSIVLREDDCAPDALESFIEGVKEKFGLNFRTFKEQGLFRESKCGMGLVWEYGGYVLSVYADDPFYVLEKIEGE